MKSTKKEAVRLLFSCFENKRFVNNTVSSDSAISMRYQKLSTRPDAKFRTHKIIILGVDI